MVAIHELVDPAGYGKEEYIRLLYDVLLEREPDPAAMAKLLQRDDCQNFFREIASSVEFRGKAQSPAYILGLQLRPRRPRVLLLGAYGNGNVGDAIQARSLQRIIGQIRPDIEVWACSALRANYPFENDRVLPADACRKPNVVNQFDMLIVGGGGLLSHPHDPLTDQEWQNAIQIPVAFVGVGAAADVAARSATLLEKAAYLSVRDDHSMSAMKKLGRTAAFLSDPVLCDVYYEQNTKRSAGHSRGIERTLWILKYAGPEQALAWQKLVDPDRDEVCFVEPHVDFPLLATFPSAKVIYDVQDLVALIDDADRVVSMRYHGCILAMHRDRPAVAVREHKSLDLYRRFGNESFFVRDLSELPRDLAGYRSPADLLLWDRARFISEMTRVLSMLKSSQPEADPPPAGDDTVSAVSHA